MRPDMYEVIIERPRHGAGWRRVRKVRVTADDDAQPKRESTSRHRGGSKGLNENLAPLRRYLRAQVGRPWDKVYSEISAHLRVTNAVQQHVRDHLEDLISIRVDERDEALWARRRGWVFELGLWGGEWLYVCPRTGLVRLLSTPRRRRRRADPPLARVVSESRAYLPLHGGWFELHLSRLPSGFEPWDHACGRKLPSGAERHALLMRLYGRTDVYCSGKRQLSRREVAALGLTRARE